jgi:hypothetical protein
MSNSGASETFVKILKDKISQDKEKDQILRNILQEGLNLVLGYLEKNLEIRNLKNFEINEICFYFDIYSDDNIETAISNSFQKNSVNYDKYDLSDCFKLFFLNLGDKVSIFSSIIKPEFFIQICSKKGNLYRVKFFLCKKGINFSIFENNYHFFKIWIYDSGKFHDYTIPLKGISRDKKKQKRVTSDKKYNVTIFLNENGEVDRAEISKIKSKNN